METGARIGFLQLGGFDQQVGCADLPYLLKATTQSTRRDLDSGSKVEVSFGMGPLKAVIGLQISALDLGHKLAFKSYSGPISWKGATTVSQNGQLKFKGLWRVWQPFAGGQIRRGEVKEVPPLTRRGRAGSRVPMPVTPGVTACAI